MRNPYRNLTSDAKAVAIFATLFIISLGLCGANYGAFLIFQLPFAGGHVAGQDAKETWGLALVMTAMLELAGIVIGAAGLVGSLVWMLFASLKRPRE